MANKIKKLSINALERGTADAMKDAFTVLDWHGEAVTVKRRLGLMEMMTFVDGVVRSCFIGENAVYTPEARDFAIRCGVLEMYANFNLPTNLEKRYELVYAFDAFGTLLDAIDRTQFDAILRAIDEKIDHIAQSNVEAVKRDMQELYASLDALEQRLSDAFGKLDADTLGKLVGVIADGGLDEAKIAEAVVASTRAERADQ